MGGSCGVVWILMPELTGPPDERERECVKEEWRRASDFGLMGRWVERGRKEEGKWLWGSERTLGSLSSRVENSSSQTDAYSQTHPRKHTQTHTHTHNSALVCNSFSASLLNPEQPLSSLITPMLPSISPLLFLIQSYYCYLTSLLNRCPFPLLLSAPILWNPFDYPTIHHKCIHFTKNGQRKIKTLHPCRSSCILCLLSNTGLSMTSLPHSYSKLVFGTNKLNY